MQLPPRAQSRSVLGINHSSSSLKEGSQRGALTLQTILAPKVMFQVLT